MIKEAIRKNIIYWTLVVLLFLPLLSFSSNLMETIEGEAIKPEAPLSEEEGGKIIADKLWGEGRALYDQKRVCEAINKFNESLKHWSDIARQEYLTKLVEGFNALLKKWRDEGEAFQKEGRLKEAVTRYRTIGMYCPTPALEEHISVIEAELKKQGEIEEKRACANRFREEGVALQQRGNIQEAIGRYKESLRCLPDPQLEEHVIKLESQLALGKEKGEKLWEECKQFYNQRKLNEAFPKCNESVKVWPQPSHKEFVQNMMAQNVKAKNLRDEGETLQQQGKLKEALEKFDESLIYWPNPRLEEHVRLIGERLFKRGKKINADGVWEQVDGVCKGSRLIIIQKEDKVFSIQGDSLCGNEKGRWAAENMKWELPEVLTYSYKFTEGKGLDGVHKIVFFSDVEAHLMWGAKGQPTLTTLKRFSPSSPKSTSGR